MPTNDKLCVHHSRRGPYPRTCSLLPEIFRDGRNAISLPVQHHIFTSVRPKVAISEETPEKNTMFTQTPGNSFQPDNIDPLLLQELAGNIQSGVSVEDFVQLVWRFDPTRLFGMNGEIDRTKCMALLQSQGFARLEKIIDDVTAENGPEISRGNSNLTPDVVYHTSKKDCCATVWGWLLITLEIKLLGRRRAACREANPIFRMGNKRKYREDDDDTSDQGAGVVFLAREYEPPAKKARMKRSSSYHRLSASSTGAVSFTKNDYQLGSSIHGRMASELRSYASGVLIRDTSIQLWYADRMGVIRSGKFDFVLQPQYMYLVLAAIAGATLQGSGYNPMIEFRDEEGTVLKRQYPSTILHSLVVLPNPIDVDGESVLDEAGRPCTPLTLEIAENTPRYIQYGLVARGTTIIAVKSPKRWGCGRNLITKMGWLLKRRTGEDEFIRTIRRKISPKWLDNIVDMKCSQTIDRQDFDLPRNRMRNLDGHKPEERVFRVLILEEYLPLTAVDSADEFKAVFLDAVRGHHYAYEEAGVLHRDLSDNNIMFRRNDGRVIGVLCDWDLAMYRDYSELKSRRNSYKVEDDGNTRTNGNDVRTELQMIEEEEEEEEGEDKNEAEMRSDAPNHRTGTGPFMAIDLLEDLTPMHRYRYDLESFFYIAVWFCASFEPQMHKYRKSALMKTWESGDFAVVHTAKTSFYIRKRNYQAIVAGAVGDFRMLLRSWVSPLYLLFREMHGKPDSGSNVESLFAEEPELDNLEQMRKDSLINYEVFMTELGAAER